LASYLRASSILFFCSIIVYFMLMFVIAKIQQEMAFVKCVANFFCC
jgi:hypothetical protein